MTSILSLCVAEAGNSEDSCQSGSMSCSTPAPAAASAAVTTFSGMIRPELSLSDMSPSEMNENSGLTSDVKSTSVLEDSSDANLDQSGAADCTTDAAPASSTKRKRGRPPAPHHLQAERRKEKLREVLCNGKNC
jgi:hypothetical protein